MNLDEIMDRLDGGESIEAIAQSYTDLLNRAVAAKKVRDAEQAKSKETEAAMEACLEDILDNFSKYLRLRFPDKTYEFMEDFTVEDLRDAVESVAPIMEHLEDFEVRILRPSEEKKVAPKTRNNVKVEKPEDVFARFFDIFGL